MRGVPPLRVSVPGTPIASAIAKAWRPSDRSYRDSRAMEARGTAPRLRSRRTRGRSRGQQRFFTVPDAQPAYFSSPENAAP